MVDPSFWSRLKNARIVRVLAVYLGASWVVLQVIELLQDGLGLPGWIFPVALILLGVGFVIVLATAWVQSHPTMESREASEEVPGDWELDLSEFRDALFRGEVPHPNWARALVGGLFVFSLLFGAAGLYVVLQDRGESFQPAAIYAGEAGPALAVLPFRVSSEGLGEWEEGLVDLLSTGLDGAAGLRAVDSRTVLSRWDGEVGDSVRPDLATALEVARGVGARFALEGSVTSIGDDVRLVCRIHDLETGDRVGMAQVEGTLDAPHGLVDRLSMEVLQILLGGDAEDLPTVDLAGVTTTSTEALRAYLRGEREYREGRFEAAVQAYQEAVAIDSTFALAHHRLYLAFGWWDRGNPLQLRHGRRARELAARLPERERLLVNGYLRMTRNPDDSTRLETTIERAVELYPNDAEAWYLLGETYYHESRLAMRPSEIEEIFQRAVELDPRTTGYRIHLVDLAYSFYADSALAARRVDALRAVSDSDDPILTQYERGSKLYFGSPDTRDAVWDSIITGSIPAASGERLPIPRPPGDPDQLAFGERLIRMALAMPTGSGELLSRAELRRILGRNLANQGRISEARDVLEDPDLAGTEQEACLLAELGFLGVSGVEDAAPDLFADSAPEGDRIGIEGSLCRALLAAEVGERTEFEEARDGVLAAAEDVNSDAFLAIPDAYWAWKQDGRPARARRMLETRAPGSFRYHFWTFLLGEIRREMGDLEEAEEAYITSLHPLSDYHYTLTWYRLAHIYDELGDPTQAREAWERVLTGWEGADPQMQARTEEAMQRLEALG